MRTRLSIWSGFALAGVLGGHWIGYTLLVPDNAERAGVLAATGHGYLGIAALAAAASALVSAFLAARRGFLSGRTDEASTWSPLRAGAALVAAQSAAFTAAELLERLFSGHPLDGVVPFLALGVAMQFLTAAAAVLLARIVEAAGRVVAYRLRPPEIQEPPRGDIVPDHPELPRAFHPAAAGVRGPPAPVFG